MTSPKWKAIVGTGLVLGWVAVESPALAGSSRALRTSVDGVVGIPGESREAGAERKSADVRARPLRPDAGAQRALHLELEPAVLPKQDVSLEGKIAAPRRVGTHRAIPAGWRVPIRGRDLSWDPVAGGGEVATFSLTSPEARALRVAVVFESLPDGAEVRFYSPQDWSDAVGPFESSFLLPATRRNQKPRSRRAPFWSPVIHGDSIAMEIYVPEWKAGRDVVFSIARVAHIHRALVPGVVEGPGDSGSCNRNLSCSTKWQESGDAVAMYIFESGDNTIQCTGQLIVDGDPDTQKDWFLTAAHCVETKAQARSMAFFFLYQQSRCSGGSFSMDQLGGGAKLKATTGGGGIGEGDHTLVRIKKNPPPGVRFQGIALAGDHVGTKKGASIGHPSGDHKKIALLRKIDELVGVDADGAAFEGTSHYVVRWKKKTVTEPGSSGSSLMVGKRWPDQFAIGVLTGGFASCADTKAPDVYGSLRYVLENFPAFAKQLRLN